MASIYHLLKAGPLSLSLSLARSLLSLSLYLPPLSISLFLSLYIYFECRVYRFDAREGVHPRLGLERGFEVCADLPEREREFFIDNLLVPIHLIIEMILVDRPTTQRGSQGFLE